MNGITVTCDLKHFIQLKPATLQQKLNKFCCFVGYKLNSLQLISENRLAEYYVCLNYCSGPPHVLLGNKLKAITTIAQENYLESSQQGTWAA